MKLDEKDIIFEKCTMKNLDEICEIQEIAFQVIDDTDMLRRNSREMLSSCLVAPHYTLGAFYNRKLIAFGVLYDGGTTDENIGLDIDGFENVLDDVVNMKLIIVLPQYRGNSLQKKLMLQLEQIAVEKGKKYICGTVSPKNIYSCNNFIATGYTLKCTKVKYGGLERNIYCKAL